MTKIFIFLIFVPFVFFAQDNNLPDDVKRVLFEIKEEMKDATNPIIATYLGSELHDYFYFPFKTDDGKIYDFAYGDNSLGEIPFGDNDFDIKSDLVGKKFIIHWKWKQSFFNCCEGRMDLYKADFPSIFKIEYVK